MGFWDKLFGRNKAKQTRPQKIEPTADMLDESVFWQIIDYSLKNSSDESEQLKVLIAEIEQLSTKDMIGFKLRTDKLLHDSYSSDMWCAAYIMNGGCSDDGFEYFRNWVISRGQTTYYTAKRHPDSLITECIEGEDYYELESFWYVAVKAFKNKTGENLYDYISDDFKAGENHDVQFAFNWNEDEPETMKAICPKLFEKMWVQE